MCEVLVQCVLTPRDRRGKPLSIVGNAVVDQLNETHTLELLQRWEVMNALLRRVWKTRNCFFCPQIMLGAF